VDHFYQTLGAVAARSFTAAEKGAGDSARFLARYAGAITSAVQVGPMADAIGGLEAPEADFTAVVSLYATALGKIHGDDRSFTYAQKAGARLEALTAQCKRRKVSPLPLLEAFRLYLVVNLSAPRCADADKMSGGGTSFGLITGTDTGAPISSLVTFFNDKLRMDPLQPIQEIESTPSRLEGEAVAAPSCQDAACKAIVERYRQLIVKENGLAVPPAERNNAEWEGRLETVLNELKRWSPGKAADADFFRDKAAIFSDLLNLAPPGAASEGVLRGLMDFLVQGREQAASRTEWFLPLNALLARTVLDPSGFGAFAAEMRKSSDPVVSVYARLDSLVPRSVDRLMGLL
jgi:hypothetical protein